MVADITIPGVGPNAPPDIYGVINYAAGQGSAGTGVYDFLLLGNGNGTASNNVLYGPNTPVQLQSASDAATLFGDGYFLDRAFVRYTGTNPNGNRAFAMQVASAPGGVAATQTFTFTTSGTITPGQVQFAIGTDTVFVPFGSNVTGSAFAATAAGFIGGNTHLPVVATANSNVLTLTTKSTNSRADWLRGRANIQPGSGAGLLINGGTDTGTNNYTGGAGSDGAGYTAAANALIALNRRFFTIVTEAGADSVDGSIVEAFVTNLIDFQAQGSIGIRQRLICGSVDTLANTVTVTTSLNDPTTLALNCYQLDTLPGELATQFAAGTNILEIPFLQSTGVNFNKFGATPATQAYWNVPAPRNGSAPSQTDINTAVVSGVSILKVLQPNRTCVVKAVTTHFWTGTSAQFDPRIVDWGKVTICNYFLDDTEAALAVATVGKMIGNDPVTGVVAANVFTPSKGAQVVERVINQYATGGLIDGVATTNGLVVQRGTNPTSRLEIQVPLFTNDPFNTAVVVVNQVS